MATARKAAIQAFKERKPPRGIFAIRCHSTGHVWVDSAMDLDTAENRTWFFLRHGDAQMDKSIAAEFQTHGRDAFTYEVLENISKEDTVKLTVVSRQGKEAIVGILGPGDFFGEACLAGQRQRMATARTLSEATIVRLAKPAAIRVLREEPEFSALFLYYLLCRNIRVEEDLVDQLFNSSEKRWARVLLRLANFGKNGKPERVLPRISQETLAEMVGTTRSRVSFFMNKFRKLGFVHYNGVLEVHTSLLNVVLPDDSRTAPQRLRK